MVRKRSGRKQLGVGAHACHSSTQERRQEDQPRKSELKAALGYTNLHLKNNKKNVRTQWLLGRLRDGSRPYLLEEELNKQKNSLLCHAVGCLFSCVVLRNPGPRASLEASTLSLSYPRPGRVCFLSLKTVFLPSF